jgi:hypothetical protein
MRKLLIAAVPFSLLLIACTPMTRSVGPVGSVVPAAAPRVLPGPSAAQFAHGRWVKMAGPPIRLCQPAALWDGRALLVVQIAAAPCRPGAAAYDPEANRWVRIATPPPRFGQNTLMATGGGGLVLVAQRTGVTAAWEPARNRWLWLPRLHAGGVISLSWTGRAFVVITAHQGRDSGRAWALAGPAGARWQALPDPPPVWHGWYTLAPAVAFGGAMYVLAHEFHGSPSRHNISGSSRLLRLTSSGWTVVPLPAAGTVGTAVRLTQTGGRLLATGDTCPSFCMETIGLAALIRPGGPDAHPAAVLLWPPRYLDLPWPAGIAAGPRAVVVTYAVGGNTLSGGDHFRAVEIYDPATGRWLAGPTAPAAPPGRAAYWTPDGVVSLGQGGGWLLRPASPQS